MRLKGTLDITALDRTINDIVGRHEALRTTFAALDGEPIQVIAPTLTVPLPIDALDAVPRATREDEAIRLVKAETDRPFDLAIGPLVRARLIAIDRDDHILVLTFHHVVADGWSLDVLFRELTALYGSYSRGAPAALPALPVQYADFAVWQRRWMEGERLD